MTFWQLKSRDNLIICVLYTYYCLFVLSLTSNTWPTLCLQPSSCVAAVVSAVEEDEDYDDDDGDGGDSG